MDFQVISKEAIERSARTAAAQGLPAGACKYPWWSNAALVWRVEYFTAVSEQRKVA